MKKKIENEKEANRNKYGAPIYLLNFVDVKLEYYTVAHKLFIWQ